MNWDLKHNFSASIVVFLVALPLCMGVAMASGVTVIQGIMAGVIGGLVVGALSGSHVSVSGPAAGLIVIVENAFADIKAFDSLHFMEIFALAVLISGVFQLILAILKLGSIADFIPVSVIKGMLAAIGIMLILKQFPHLVGYDRDAFGEAKFIQKDGHNTFSEIYYAIKSPTALAVIIGFLGIFIQLFYDFNFMKKAKWKTYVPAPLLVVAFGIIINNAAISFFPEWAIQRSHMVNIPIFSETGNIGESMKGLFGSFYFPHWQAIQYGFVWKLAALIAVIASVESLLSLEAGDKIDSLKRSSNPNRELWAQGIGNILAGFIGALPVTAVIVRTSANVNAGSTNRSSAVLHGFWLLLFVVLAPKLINQIPLSALASVLIFVGYKLAKPSLFKEQYQRGWNAIIPFVITIIAILLSDLLIGILVGILVGYIFILRTNYVDAVTVVHEGDAYLVRFHSQTSFMNKALVKKRISNIPPKGSVIFDFSNNSFIDTDIIDMIGDYCEFAERQQITVEMKFHDDVQKNRILTRL